MRGLGRSSGNAASASPVSVGLIGCGRVAMRWHIPALAALPEARLAAVADLDPDRLAAAARHGAEAHRDPEALIADAAIEAVAICVPAPSHANVAAAALDAGKHVLVEKPLALSLADCDRIAEAAARAGTVATVGFNLRHHRLVQRARDAVRDGIVGEVAVMQTTISGNDANAPAWIRSQELGGGVMIEKGVHHYDLWRHLLGAEVEQVSAVSQSGWTDDHTAAVSARMSNGAVACTALSESSRASNGVHLLGGRARMDLSLYEFDGFSISATGTFPGDPRARLRGLARAARELPGALRPARRGGDFAGSYRGEWRAFCESVRGGPPPQCSLDDGRRAVAVALAAVASARRGEPVAVADAGPDLATAAGAT